MDPKQPSYEPISLRPDVEGIQRMLGQLHWYVAVLALVFGITINLVRVTPQFFVFSNLIGLSFVTLLVVAVRRRNYLYLGSLWTGLVMFAMYKVTRFAWSPGELESVSAFGIGFLIPFLLVWIGRRWVTKLCRFDEPKTLSKT